jgi:RNA polymerase-binding transcription factor DksA
MEVAIIQDRTDDVGKPELTHQEIFEDLEHFRAELRSIAEPCADQADVDAYEREKAWALVQRLERKLESNEHALRMARAGTYGICESCGDRIDSARLEVLPEATLCLDYQRQIERQHKRRRSQK